MKSGISLLLGIALLFSACSEKPTIADLEHFAPPESFPDDTYLDSATVKKALVIIAHDDDDCFMAGTIYKLKANGWQVEQWKLVDTPLEEGATSHPADVIYTSQKTLLEDGHFRNTNPNDSTRLPHLAIPKEQFAAIFETEKVTKALLEKVNAFKPTVIFTMDHEMGGYGHPEHVFISGLVHDLFQKGQLAAQRLYQGVTTNHMEEEIIVKHLTAQLKEWGYENPYLVGKEVYKIDGIPEPEVQVNIESAAEGKMEYLRAYSEEARQNIRKFIPYYEDFDAKTYFGLFNREFFRVYEKPEPSGVAHL